MNFQALIWQEPWLAPIAVNISHIVATDRVASMGITPDGKTLYYNPTYWKALSKEEQLGSQAHVLLHIANRHMDRQEGREKTRWNLACDLSINYLLRFAGYALPPGVIYENMHDSAETIYDWLDDENRVDLERRASRVRKNAGLTGKGKTKEKGTSGKGEVPSDGEGASEENGDEFRSELPLSGDLLEENEDGSDSCPVSTWDAIDKAIALSKMAGHGTTVLSRLFTPYKGRADWRVILQNYVKSAVGDDLDYLSYEFDEFGVCEDILSPKPKIKICALVDESGSISDELYEQFLGELLKMDRYAEVDAAGFTDRTELNAVPVREYRRTMRGGTDVRHTYEQACQKEYDCIIILTDGYLEFPEREPLPTIWTMPQSFGRKMEVIL